MGEKQQKNWDELNILMLKAKGLKLLGENIGEIEYQGKKTKNTYTIKEVFDMVDIKIIKFSAYQRIL